VARLILLVLALAFLVAIPFALWGGAVEQELSIDGVVAWLRAQDGWGWAIGIGLIASDIVLPVPSTGVMAALGVVYGPVLGGAISAAGSMVAGMAGYWLCRALGPRVALQVAGETGFGQAQRLFQRWGIWLVALSRWIPVLPETVAFLAGFSRMPFARFALALAAGALPLGFLFATAGHLGAEAPILIIVICAVAPLGLWAVWRWALARRRAA
jgi:uncharacterized membrane protein YdjX (TVP38/TMEM64 family)